MLAWARVIQTERSGQIWDMFNSRFNGTCRWIDSEKIGIVFWFGAIY